jgi:enoyl-CoA hydratase
MEPYKQILYRVEERIARVTLNAPEKRNALSFLMRDENVDALRTAEADDDVSIVLIDGSGPSFCSGYDMSAGHRSTRRKAGSIRRISTAGRISSPAVVCVTG